MSRSAFSFVTSRRSRSISSCSGFNCPRPGRACAGSELNSFSRRLDLFARRGEVDTLAKRIAELSRGILHERYLPQVRKAVPWLASEFLVGC
jgi:hypothetical protein